MEKVIIKRGSRGVDTKLRKEQGFEVVGIQ